MAKTRKKAGTREPFDPYGTTLREIIRWKLIIYARRSNKGSIAIETEINKFLKDKNINVEKDGELHINEKRIRQIWGFPAKNPKITKEIETVPDLTQKEVEIFSEYLKIVLPEYSTISIQQNMCQQYADIHTKFIHPKTPNEEHYQQGYKIAENLQIRTFISIQENNRIVLINFRKIPGTNYLWLCMLLTNPLTDFFDFDIETGKKTFPSHEVRKFQNYFAWIMDNFEKKKLINSKFHGLMIPDCKIDLLSYIKDWGNTEPKDYIAENRVSDTLKYSYSGIIQSIKGELINAKFAYAHSDSLYYKELNGNNPSVYLKLWLPEAPAHLAKKLRSLRTAFITPQNRHVFSYPDPCLKDFIQVDERRALEFFDKQFTYVSL